MTDIELMQQALASLEGYARNCRCEGNGRLCDAGKALKARLAQPEPEPVAQIQVAEDYHAHVVWLDGVDPVALDQQYLYVAPQRKEEPEPFAEVRLNMTGGNAGLSTRIVQLAEGHYPEGTKLYLAPPPREFIGLTDDEIMKMLDYGQYGRVPAYARNFVDAIEAKLKEKNNG